MNETFSSNLFVKSYKRLVIVGLTGSMHGELDKVEPFIMHGCPGMEIAPIQHKIGRDSLAMFAFDPTLDIKVEQYSFRSNVIIGYSLDWSKLTKTIEQLAESISFLPHQKRSTLLGQSLEGELKNEMANYHKSEEISNHISEQLGNVWGMRKYVRFLRVYGRAQQKTAEYLA